jgi:tRNA/tmRNA/rRNA uracil-C5-methylase (TrmA/RlmC/RlmD family)
LYERRSHKIVEIPECVVHHPNINKAIEILRKATINVKTPAWGEDSGFNGLRYVQLSVERMTGRVSMTLVWHANTLKQCQPHLSRIIKECKKMDRDNMNKNNEGGPGLFHSIYCHTNDGLGNAIFARGEKNWHPMDGPEFTRESIPGTNVEDREGLLYFTPMVFRQGNLDGFDEIAMHVARSIGGGGQKVCELYAGVGLLGLTALTYWQKQGEPLGWVRCSDENPNNPRCFKKSVNSM